MDKVSCKICGKKFKTIINSHLKLHGIDRTEYLRMFPNARLHSKERLELLRNNASKGAKARYTKDWKNSEDRKRQQEIARIMGKKRAKACKENPELAKKRADTMRRVREQTEKENPDIYRLAAIKSVQSQISSRSSKLEDKVANMLDELNIRYERQKEIAFYLVDFFLPDYHTVIEVQGDYWHGNPDIYTDNLNKVQIRNIKHFEKKRRIIQNSGINVIELWENDINNKEKQTKLFLEKELSL